MISRLLYSLSGRMRCRLIYDGNVPYLERYYVCTLLGVRMYLHRFVGSDPDRGHHDHPWPWALSIVLRDFYYEQRRSGTRIVRWFNFLTGDTFHRVILPTDHGVHEVWTLFIHRAKDVKPWGFLRDKGQMGIVFTPFNYPRGKETEWWRSAPIGKVAPRQPRQP